MINLIPKEERKRMIAAFYYRLAVLFFLVLDFCILVLFISMLPSYFLSSAKMAAVNTRLDSGQNALPASAGETLAAVSDINGKLGLIENAEKNKFSVVQKVINAVLLSKRSDIKITKILYESDGGKKISITGTAPSREVLLLFRTALEGNPAFKSVDLPISNFTKGADIQFSINLIPA
jgi:hypothetical protein